MRLYDARPARRSRQVVFDVVVVACAVLAVVAGVAISRAIASLAAIGSRVQRDGSAFRDQLDRAADALGRIPLGGTAVGRPLRDASDSAGSIAAAGARQHDDTIRLAHLVGGGTASLLIIVLVLLWLLVRGRALRGASAAARLATSPDGTALLALRALVTRDGAAALGPDVVGRWRDGDPAVVAALADLERRESGLPVSRRS